MFSTIRKRVTYANVAVTLALVFAMSGGAYAASHYVITSTKQIKPSVLKSLQGKPGKTGPTGPAGTAGTGTPGAQGPQGPAGTNGTNGTNGAPGESVTNKALPKGAPCPEGGAEFKVGNGAATHACNGTNGTTGFTATLPAEATETGAWAVESSSASVTFFAISFPIPLEAALAGGSSVHAVTTKEVEEHKVPAGCTVKAVEGSAANPLAAPGNLCVYAAKAGSLTGGLITSPGSTADNPGTGTTGAYVVQTSEIENEHYYGTWAVTAPE